ncbi:MAG: GNAT family N-acetyltransferase [Gemmatimonadetes bacterium]|nr:GNAT family N-acetyltransferase [Gemmatimonadota bacterium]
MVVAHSFATDDASFPEWESAGGPAEPLPNGVRCLLARRDNAPVARLAWGMGSVGFIGWYEARDSEAGVALLRQAREELGRAGAREIVGPLNGSTWGRYRWALSGTGEAPPFLGEPCNPPEYPAQWEAAGFRPVAEYQSRIFHDPEPDAARLRASEERAAEQGIQLRPLDLERWDDELRDIHALSLASFADNPFYTPIGLRSFHAANNRLRPLLVPELVRLAHDAAGRLLGLAFAYPDGASGRVVLKTLATAPEARGLRLATLLTEQIHAVAQERGASAVIHALMHVSNRSAQMSVDRRTELFRRYALYAG